MPAKKSIHRNKTSIRSWPWDKIVMDEEFGSVQKFLTEKLEEYYESRPKAKAKRNKIKKEMERQAAAELEEE